MKRVVLLAISEETSEIKALLDTLGAEVVREFIQNRAHPHKVSFLGPGKIDEVATELEDFECDFIAIDGSLKPSQHHFLEMKFQKECVDRPGVILRIFADHAHTPEAIAQVTLAKLRYEMPFLREWVHKAKSGERPGFLAGGAYATDVYYEHAKTQSRRIEQTLSEISRQREITRTKRREGGYSLVSLSGYTNAGKSALMNRLCASTVEVDPRLFSTLATTTRRVLGIRGNVLMSDTVGFIRDLPPELIKAFNSTLEEIFFADLILLIFDSSDVIDQIKAKIKDSLSVLKSRTEGRDIVLVGNKVDLISDERELRVEEAVKEMAPSHELYFVSALTGEGLETLRERISAVQDRSCFVQARLPLTDAAYGLLSRIRKIADVDQNVLSDSLEVEIRCKPEDREKISGWLGNQGAKALTSRCESRELPQEGTSSNGKEGAPLSTKS
jgi:GTP-binding protein HflX